MSSREIKQTEHTLLRHSASTTAGSKLANVRVLVERILPSEYRAKFTWRQLAGMIRRAAEGQQDIAEVSLALSVSCSNLRACRVSRAKPPKQEE